MHVNDVVIYRLPDSFRKFDELINNLSKTDKLIIYTRVKEYINGIIDGIERRLDGMLRNLALKRLISETDIGLLISEKSLKQILNELAFSILHIIYKIKENVKLIGIDKTTLYFLKDEYV